MMKLREVAPEDSRGAMRDSGLGPLKLNLKSGTEQFSKPGGTAGFDVLEFWRWSASDLVLNTTRGALAEFIVAKALDLDVSRPREGWATWDLSWPISPDTTLAIEVKSSAYLQSWGQKDYSVIQFVVPKRRGYDAVENELESSASRHAHVYVLALLAHKDKATLDPLNLEQWRFYVLPTTKLDDRTRSQHSITLKSLEGLAGDSIGFDGLASAVKHAGLEQLASRPAPSVVTGLPHPPCGVLPSWAEDGELLRSPPDR